MKKDIPGYEGLYIIDEDGNVFSSATNKPIEWIKLQNGYFAVGLYKNKRENQYKIHRLVAYSCIPNPNEYEQINHIDEDKSNGFNKSILNGQQINKSQL